MTPIRICFFFLFTVFSIIVPYLQVYLKLSGYTITEIGMMLGIFEIAGIIGPLILGFFADRIQKYRLTLIITVLWFTISFTLLHHISGIVLSIVFIFLMGFSFRSTIPISDAIASRFIQNPVADYGKTRVIGSLGFITFLLIIQFTSLSLQTADQIYNFTLLLSLILLISIIFTPEIKKNHTLQPKHWLHFKFSKTFWLGMLIFFFGRFGLSAYYSFYSLFLKDMGQAEYISGMWALGAISELPTIFFSGYLIQKFGIKKLIQITMFGIIIRLSLYAYFENIILLFGAQLLHAITFGVFHTCAIAFINLNTAKEQRATGISIYMAFSMGLSGFIGSFCGGYIINWFDYSSLFLGYTVFPLIGLLMIALFFKQTETKDIF